MHILSTHLIQKQRIYEIEKMLKEQLFGKNHIQVQLVEQYDLSAQYTPENLMNEYLDSIYLELGNRSVVERSMMQGASYSFEDENILCLRLTDTIVAEGKKEALSSYLKDIFAERFQRPIEVRVLYEEAKDSKLKYNDMKLKQEVNAILDHAEAMQAEKGVLEKQEDKKESKAGKEKVSPGKEKRSFSSYGKGKRDNYSPIKRNSDDPNLVYGRDFDDDPIELRTVVGEMGEITLRGKIISFDTREIRNEKTIVILQNV